MPLEMTLWRVDGASLREIEICRLDREQRLEDWIVADPTVLGMELAILGRQVQTAHGGRADILALDREAKLSSWNLRGTGLHAR